MDAWNRGGLLKTSPNTHGGRNPWCGLLHHHPLHPTLEVVAKRADLRGLPVRKANRVSGGQRRGRLIGGGVRSSAIPPRSNGPGSGRRYRLGAAARAKRNSSISSTGGSWSKEEYVGALVQILPGEAKAVPLQLLKLLAKIKGGKRSADPRP